MSLQGLAAYHSTLNEYRKSIFTQANISCKTYILLTGFVNNLQEYFHFQLDEQMYCYFFVSSLITLET